MSWRDRPFRRYRDGPQPMSRGVERVMKWSFRLAANLT